MTRTVTARRQSFCGYCAGANHRLCPGDCAGRASHCVCPERPPLIAEWGS